MSRKIPPDAFAHYVSQGPGRSYQAVADHYKVSKRAVTKCAAREHWTERLREIERNARDDTDRAIAETLSEMRERHLKTLRAMHGRVVKALKDFPLTSGMEAIRAAETVIKLERLIAGESCGRTELTLEQVTRHEIEKMLAPDDHDGGDDTEDW